MGGQQDKVGGQKNKVGGQKNKVGGQKNTRGGQKNKVGGQKTRCPFYGDDLGMVSNWVYYDQNDDHVNGDWWEV